MAEQIINTGYRKSSIAKVIARPGTGKILINGKDYKDYFPSFYQNYKILEPLKLTGKERSLDFKIYVEGGGTSAQADAIRHGIAKAISEIFPYTKLILKEKNLLTRDIRIKERKKYGLRKARKARQYRKR